MSHIVILSTEIRDLGILKSVLEEKGFSYTEQQAVIYDYYNRSTPVDLAVMVNGTYRFGFRKREETYQLLGDFYGLSIKSSQLTADLKRDYARLKILKELEAHKFQIISESKVGQDIVLHARRWVA